MLCIATRTSWQIHKLQKQQNYMHAKQTIAGQLKKIPKACGKNESGKI